MVAKDPLVLFVNWKEEKHFAVRPIRTLMGSIRGDLWIESLLPWPLDQTSGWPRRKISADTNSEVTTPERHACPILNCTFSTFETDSAHRPWWSEPKEESAASQELATHAGREHHCKCDSSPLSQKMALYLEQDLCDWWYSDETWCKVKKTMYKEWENINLPLRGYVRRFYVSS